MSGPSAGNDPLSPHNTPPPNRNPNREALRLEMPANQTKQTSQHRSHREKEAWFSPPVGEGVYLPPGLGLGVGWNLGGARRASDIQISNRESLRLETPATQTKQRTQPRSNREVEALFRAGSGLMIQSGETMVYPPSSSHQNTIYSARKLPTGPKNTTTYPSFLFRLKTTPTVYFVGVTVSFNLTMLRLRRTSIEPVFRQSDSFSRARNRRRNLTHISRTSNRDTNLLETHAYT
jgi:hypothetical protein